MGRMQKQVLRGIMAIGLAATMMLAAGCGDDNAAAPTTTTGTVVKGPVIGAAISATVGGVAKTATTISNGQYTISAVGVDIFSTGGTYVDISTTPRTNKTAPNMATPAGSGVISPLTTVVQSVPVAERAALAAKIATAFGVAFDADLSVKTAANANGVTAAEAFGAAMVAAGSANVSALVTALAQEISRAAAPPAVTAAGLSAFVASAIAHTTSPTAGLTAASAAIVSATGAASTAAIALPNGALPITTSTATGPGGGLNIGGQ